MIPELKENENGKFEKWMGKGKFYVRLYDRLAECIGYIDTEHRVAFNDDESLIWNENKWTATDIGSGTKVANGRTFEECYKNMMAVWERIEERRNSSDYDTWKRQLQYMLEGKLGDKTIRLELEDEYI